MRRSSRARPVNSTKLRVAAAGLRRIGVADRHRSRYSLPAASARGTRGRRASARSSSRRSASASRSIRVCVGSPGTFSTRKWRSARLAICGRCVIVTTWARAPSRASVSADGVRRLAADAGVDLVEDHRLAAADRGDRERDARELAARGGLGDRRERQARVRADQERDLVGAGRAGVALAAARRGTRPRPCPTPRSSSATAAANGASASVRALAKLLRELATLRLGGRELLGGGARRIVALRERVELGPGLGGAREQLLVASRRGSGAWRRRSGRARPRPPRAGRARPRARRGTPAARSPSRAGGARRRAARRRPARARARAARAARPRARRRPSSPAAPSPSSGASASAAVVGAPRRAR